MTLRELTDIALKFRDEREWKQFHSPKELAIQMIIEAGELLEHMQWRNGAELEKHLQHKRKDVEEELADILHGLVLVASEMDIDLGKAFVEKMKKSAEKYPVHKVRGSAKRYSDL
jgi:NTP pyrophosphatase (non-canonical NTP hydrolase)